MFFANAVKRYGEYGDFSKLWKGEGVAQAIRTVEITQENGTPVSKDFLRCILQGCLRTKNLEAARHLHVILVRNGLLSNDCLAEELIRLFSGCNQLSLANQLFSTLPPSGLFSWNAIIAAHINHCKHESALQLFELMSSYDIGPDKVTYLLVIKACSTIKNVDKSRLIHSDFISHGSGSLDVIIKAAIIDMYAMCVELEDAMNVFASLPVHDIVTWSVMISGLVASGRTSQAIYLVQRMQSEGRRPNEVILSSVLTACASSAALSQGRLVHDQIIVHNFQNDIILGNNLVELYSKCGSMKEACNVFHSLPVRNLVTWTSIISGYVRMGNCVLAMQLYMKMLEQGVKPDAVILVFILKSCSILGAIACGMAIHDECTKDGIDTDLAIGNALLGMYAKCGKVRDAQHVFNHMREHDVVSWGTLFSGLMRNGDWISTLTYFDKMKNKGIQPDSAIFTNILKACTCGGRLSEAYKHFQAMTNNHNIKPHIVHYSCMIDLLGRMGDFYGADDLRCSMPISCNAVSLTSLLASHGTFGNVNLGGLCFSDIFNVQAST